MTYYAANYHATGQFMLVCKWKAVPFAWAMLVGFGAYILVSLLTPAEDSHRVEEFFDKMNRSSDGPEGAGELDEHVTASQAGALTAVATQKHAQTREAGQDLLLLDLPGFCTLARWRRFFVRYREDLVGFVLAWGTVALLVLTAWGVMQLGK